MFIRTRLPLPVLIAGLAAAVVVVGCSDSGRLPAGPSAGVSAGSGAASTGSALPAVMAAGGRAQRVVDLFDACDPETFNDALGAGTCVRNGGIRFENFLEQLIKGGRATNALTDYSAPN